MPQFTQDEYEQLLKHPAWTYEETAHLMELSQRFDLRYVGRYSTAPEGLNPLACCRWPVIADRYDRATYDDAKNMEDLKERYYSIEHELAVARGRPPPEMSYDAEHEKRRKEQLNKLWDRTEEQVNHCLRQTILRFAVKVKEEEELIAAIKRIEMKRKERERKAQEVQRLINVADRTRTSLSPERYCQMENSVSQWFFFSSSGFSPGAGALRNRGRSSMVKGRPSQSVAAQLAAQVRGSVVPLKQVAVFRRSRPQSAGQNTAQQGRICVAPR